MARRQASLFLGHRAKNKKTKRAPWFFCSLLRTSNLGEEVAWGPRGHHGFSLTTRIEEEWKLIHLAAQWMQAELTQINVKLERFLNTHGVILEFRGTS